VIPIPSALTFETTLDRGDRRETKFHNILRNNCAEKRHFLPVFNMGNRLKFKKIDVLVIICWFLVRIQAGPPSGININF